MRKGLYILSLALCASSATMLTSCFKEEPLNAECDIESVAVHCADPSQAFYNLTDTMQVVSSADSVVTFSVRSSADLSSASLSITTTSGATASVTSGSTTDLGPGKEVHYRVTSQDGNWHRDYTVKFVAVTHTVSDTIKYDFEYYELEPKASAYYLWHNLMPDGTLGNDWSTANPGYQISRPSATKDDYPTIPLTEGYDGAGVSLITRDTGGFGVMVNMRLAAGNMFLGSFDVGSAMKDAMKATRFGVGFDKKPVKFTGYFQYTPGTKFQNRAGKEVEGRVDKGSIYAVLYRNHDSQGNAVMLDGSNVLTSDLIVALAQVENVTTTDGWTYFEIPFNYTEGINNELLSNRGYNLAVVFSSSADGASFEGAVGSHLKVDKVRVICATEE